MYPECYEDTFKEEEILISNDIQETVLCLLFLCLSLYPGIYDTITQNQHFGGKNEQL